MNTWNFQVKKTPKELGKELASSFEDTKRFVLKMNNDKMNKVEFKLRKRLSLPFEINTQNNLIVKGKIVQTTAGESAVALSFSQHPLAQLLMYGHIILGLGFLAGIFLNLNNDSYMYIIAAILLAIGILLGIHFRKVFDKNVQEYKSLIAGILES